MDFLINATDISGIGQACYTCPGKCGCYSPGYQVTCPTHCFTKLCNPRQDPYYINKEY